MSHVTSGDLHTVLDGALEFLSDAERDRIESHLAACDDCAERLEEERVQRDAATAILVESEIEVGTPPAFEELMARAAAVSGAGVGGGKHQRAYARTKAVGWAATVVIALGTGWLLGRQPELLESPMGDDLAGTASSAESFRQDSETSDLSVEPEVRLEEAELPSVSGAVSEDQRETPEPVARSVAAEMPAPEFADAAGSGARVDEVVVAERDMPPALALEELVVVGDSTGRVGADSPARAQALQAPPIVAQARERARTVPMNSLVGSAAAPSAAPTAPAEERADVADLTAKMSADRALVIPGLAVLSVEWVELVPGVMGVRVVQELEEGAGTLELLHGGMPGEGAASDPDQARQVPSELEGSMPDGMNQVTAFASDGGWIVARGSLSEERLRALLELLR